MKQFLTAAIVLWVGAILQVALPGRMQAMQAQPDFILIASASLGLLLWPTQAMVTGFFGGLLHGLLAGANLTQYVVSRMIGTYASSRAHELGFEMGPVFGGIVVALSSGVTDIAYLFFAPPASIPAYLQTSLASALYNGLLAVPVVASLQRILQSDDTGV